MKAPLYIAFLITLLFTACKKETDAGPKDIIGNWNWVRTDGGIGFHIHLTPANTGKNIELRLMNGNNYAFYTNGALTSQGSFTTRLQRCIHDGTDKRVIDFSQTADADMMVERVNEQTLILSDDFFDGMTEEYSRK
jgi:hypothetical protein